MKLILKKNSTSKILRIFITDSSKTDGSGLTGLVHNTASLTAYYIREGAASTTAITLVTATVGTFTSSGFKEVDATNMPGVYELHPPNACIASGADSVLIFLKGASNMAALPLEIQLDDNDAKDIYDRIGAPTGASIAADIVAVPSDTWDEILTGATHNIATSAGRRLREVGAYAIESGTAQAGTAASITLAATANGTNGIYNRNLIVLTDNTGKGQTRTIVDYNATTKVVAVDRDWRVAPDNTTEYQITPDDTPLTVDHGLVQGASPTTVTIRDYASTINNAYLCNQIAIIAGTGRGQVRLVGAYNGTTKVVTICGDPWVVNPDATSVYAMMPYGTTCASCMSDNALAQINAEIDTDVATQDSASSFTCTAGVTADNAYIGMIVRVQDAGDAHWEDRMITGWTAGRVMTVDKPFSFTPAVNDLVWILSQYEEKDTTFVNR